MYHQLCHLIFTCQSVLRCLGKGASKEGFISDPTLRVRWDTRTWLLVDIAEVKLAFARKLLS